MRDSPDFVYDPDNWEITYEWSDRYELVEEEVDRPGEWKRFSTLIKGPDKFCAYIPVEFDDDGAPLRWERIWFDSEEAVKAAIKTANSRDAK